MNRSTLATILKKAEMISKAIELEAEEILEDAERAVKETVPACNVHAALIAIEKELNKEGIEALFQKATSKTAIKKTASETLSKEELSELVSKVCKAIIDEFEDVLNDTDEVCDDEITKIGDDYMQTEGKLKGILEKKLADKGIYAKLARKQVAKKVAVASKATKATEIMAKNRAARNK